MVSRVSTTPVISGLLLTLVLLATTRNTAHVGPYFHHAVGYAGMLRLLHHAGAAAGGSGPSTSGGRGQWTPREGVEKVRSVALLQLARLLCRFSAPAECVITDTRLRFCCGRHHLGDVLLRPPELNTPFLALFAFGPAGVSLITPQPTFVHCLAPRFLVVDVQRAYRTMLDCCLSFMYRWEQDMKVEWALHVIPCVAMLYLMRKAGEPTASSLNGGRDSDNRSSGERTGFAEGGVDDEAGERGGDSATKNRNEEGAGSTQNYGNYGSGDSLR